MTKIIGIPAPFDPTQDQDITGSWSFSLVNGQLQGLMTDDPTLAAPTYLFGTFNHPVFAPTVKGDRRYIDVATATGYNAILTDGGDGIVAISTHSAAIGTSYVQTYDLNKIVMRGEVLEISDLRYTDTTALATAIPSPVQDQYVMVTGKGLAVYDGAAWVHAADDTTPINSPLTGGGGIETWTPTEVEKVLIIDEPIQSVTITTVGSDLSIDAGVGIGIAKSGPNTRMVSGKNGIYLKMNELDDGTLPAGAYFRVSLTGYPTNQVSSYAPYVRIEKQGDNTWTAYFGGGGLPEAPPVTGIADADIHQAEVCVAFEILDANSITTTAYVAGNSTPIYTHTITTGNATEHYKSLRLNQSSTIGVNMEVLVIGIPASPITGVTQIKSTGILETASYPVARTNKTFQVTGLNYPLNDVISNKIVSNGCLVTFDANDDMVESTAEENNLLFYIDWYYDDTFILDGATYWNNGANGPTSNPYGTLTLGTRREHVVANILTPNGDSLSNYDVISATPMIRSNSMWFTPGWIYGGGGGIGSFAGYHENTSNQKCVVIQSGSVATTNDHSSTGGGTFGTVTLATSPKPARIRIVARK